MPYKSCTHCHELNGVRTHYCKHCGEGFSSTIKRSRKYNTKFAAPVTTATVIVNNKKNGLSVLHEELSKIDAQMAELSKQRSEINQKIADLHKN